MPRKVTCTISLDPAQMERLDTISKKTRISRSELVREALDQVLAKHEEQLSLLERFNNSTARRRGKG